MGGGRDRKKGKEENTEKHVLAGKAFGDYHMCSTLSSPWSLMFFLKLKTLFFLKLRLSTTDIKTMRPERADPDLSV